MQIQWDYSGVAKSYSKRPDYAADAINQLFQLLDVPEGKGRACDVGAGTGHLTKFLAPRFAEVVALEPNCDMRAEGVEATRTLSNVLWKETPAENTCLEDRSFDLVTFGSSFNVTDRQRALAESARILRPGGWFACMWNHRDLRDGHQQAIETIIAELVPCYNYGTRREDQRSEIESSGLFAPVHYIEAHVNQTVSPSDWLDAWRSHVTLKRQANDRFPAVIEAIGAYLKSLNLTEMTIPYTTRLWAAQAQSSLFLQSGAGRLRDEGSVVR